MVMNVLEAFKASKLWGGFVWLLELYYMANSVLMWRRIPNGSSLGVLDRPENLLNVSMLLAKGGRKQSGGLGGVGRQSGACMRVHICGVATACDTCGLVASINGG